MSQKGPIDRISECYDSELFGYARQRGITVKAGGRWADGKRHEYIAHKDGVFRWGDDIRSVLVDLERTLMERATS